VRERNQLFWESKLKHEATVKDINNENKRRVEKSERYAVYLLYWYQSTNTDSQRHKQ
jgi:hypothetical protein